MSAPVPAVQRARNLVRPPTPETSPLDLERLKGRLIELSEPRYHGALTALVGLLAQAQSRREVVAWVAGSTVFYPPDLAFVGVDPEAVVVVRVPGDEALRAVDWLLRSRAYAVVVAEVSQATEATLGRLARLAAEGQTALVFLTRKDGHESSLGSQVSLRVAVEGPALGRARVQVVRDKGGGALNRQEYGFDGPLGLY